QERLDAVLAAELERPRHVVVALEGVLLARVVGGGQDHRAGVVGGGPHLDRAPALADQPDDVPAGTEPAVEPDPGRHGAANVAAAGGGSGGPARAARHVPEARRAAVAAGS